MKPLVRRTLGALGVVGATSVAVALYFRTQPTVIDRHATIVDRFGSLHALDATLSHRTLAARYGLSSDYDGLTRSAQQFEAQLRGIGSDLAQLAAEHGDLRSALAELTEQAARRHRAVEDFKTQNSVLKNSLFYLPLAARQVQEELALADDAEAGDATPRQIEAVIGDIVQATLVQNLLGGRNETRAVHERIELAEALETKVPQAARSRYRLLLAHARTASQLQQKVDPIVRRDVLEAPVGASLARLERGYGQQFDAALKQVALYRSVLYAWSTLLLVAVLVAAFKLRSLYSRLGELVRTRTEELEKALEELWGEMQLAKKIQTALVPRELSLRGCDVAAVMRPTDQVGGDYYDIVEVDGFEWVLIGDVSGHGVPAGLVMMMCQTSVRSVLTAKPDVSPDVLLAMVNRTLTENIQRLGENKYMTISALRHDPDGSFRVAGMHQDLLIYRASERRLERVRTEGTWLGITLDIRRLNPVRTVHLDPGDTLVLYTDGITEARREGKMLDIDGLGLAIEENGGGSADEVLQGILASLDGYQVDDDVAAVVIKQIDARRTAGESNAA
jgi:serine phosphatase RsbU (regulator of sigma subunit)